MKIKNYPICFTGAMIILGGMFTQICTGQGLMVSQGTSMSGIGGIISLSGDLSNNGTFMDSGGTVFLIGSNQEFKGTTPGVFYNLTIGNGSTTTLTTPGQTVSAVLLCDGTLNADGNLTLLSNETHTALIDGSGAGEVRGNVTMQRYLRMGFGYKYFGSPFQDALVSEFSDNMKLDDPFPAFYSYDESRTTSGWVTYIDPAAPLNPFEGYAVNFGASDSPITFDVTGVVNNGPLTRTLYNHDNTYTRGFSLAGNPYPSPVDWDSPAGWTRNNIDNALYYFVASTTDEYGGSYSTYLNGISSNDTATNLIPAMQGFFVHVSDGPYPVTGSMTVNNQARVLDLSSQLIKSGGSSLPLIRLAAAYDNEYFSSDPTVIYFEEKATGAFDGQFDALKLMNTDYFMVNFYSLGSDRRKLSINALPFVTDSILRVPLGVATNMAENVIFSVRSIQGDFPGLEVTFSDDVANSVMAISVNNTYKVFLTEGVYEDRFFLNFRNLNTGVEPPPASEENAFDIYSSKGVLYLKINRIEGTEARFRLLNLAGQPVMTRNFSALGTYELEYSLKGGIYIADLASRNARSARKLYIESH